MSDAVDAAARAIFEAYKAARPSWSARQWETEAELAKNGYRDEARKAVTAYLNAAVRIKTERDRVAYMFTGIGVTAAILALIPEAKT